MGSLRLLVGGTWGILISRSQPLVGGVGCVRIDFVISF